MTRPTLYHMGISYYSMIARLVLAEKAVDYDSRELDIEVRFDNLYPDYARIQPKMTVPAMVHGEQVLTGSDSILDYVARQLPGPDLYPNPLAEEWVRRHYAFEVENLTMGRIANVNPLLRKLMLNKRDKQRRLCLKFAAENPDLEQLYQTKAETFVAKSQGLEGNQRYEKALLESRQLLDELEQRLNTEPYVAGQEYSAADVVWTVFLVRLAFLRKHEEISSRPALADYWTRVQSRPSFQAADMWTAITPRRVVSQIWQQFSRS